MSRLIICAAGIMLSLTSVGVTDADADKTTDSADVAVSVALSATRYVELPSEITRVSTGSADIADVKAFPPNQLLVTGRRAGVTNATVWTRKGIKVVAIEVTFPTKAIRNALRKAIPTAKKLDVITAGAALLLSGEVDSVEDIARAETLAHSLLAAVTGDSEVAVINTMRVPGDQQVQLEVTFAEVSRSALRQIGFNFWSKRVGGSGNGYAGGLVAPTSSLGSLAPSTQSPDIANLNHGGDGGVPLIANPIQGAFGFIFSSTLGGFPFSAALSLMSTRGYARTLAEPTLVALSGKSANFLAGGEFPIPIPQSLGQTAIEYRKFGVQLQFTPTIMGDNIQLELAMTVSDIDQSLGVRIESTSVPGLTTRHSQSTVRLRDGQSFVIAGLLSDRVRSTVDKVPMLGDIPILGTLFRSSSYRREETELLVVVTAHRVAPLDERPALPGEDMTADPSDLELFFLGKGESQRGKHSKRRRHVPVGAVGFKR